MNRIPFLTRLVQRESVSSMLRRLRDYDEDEQTEVFLGEIRVTTKGDGSWMTKPIKKAINFQVIATYDIDSIIRDANDKVEFADITLWGVYPMDEWDTETQGLLYTDSAIPKAVNRLLKNLGFKSRCEWSQHDEQGRDFCDFDIDYNFIDELEALRLKLETTAS